jgi:hypothetical protein
LFIEKPRIEVLKGFRAWVDERIEDIEKRRETCERCVSKIEVG